MGNPRTARMMTADDADDRPTPTFTRRHVLGTLTIGSVALATLAIGCLALTAPRSSLSVARLDGECAGYVVQKGDSCWALTHSARPIEYLELDGVKYCCDGCSVDIAAGVCYECHGVGCNSQPGPGPSPSPPAVMTTPVIGTYYGAMPGNPALRPQPMSELSDAINMVMLSFAKDPENTGSFVPFASWIENKINYNSITADRAAYKARTGKERSYLISLGGAADSGGTFAIKPGMSASEWIENADASVTEIVHQYGAQGVEMQFEGGTGDVHFVEAMNTLLQRFQGKGFITAIGPWYSRWGTSGDYANVSPDHIDAVNMQMYADPSCRTVSCQKGQVQSAIGQTPGGVDKFVYGLCSASNPSRGPSPSQGLTFLQGALDGSIYGEKKSFLGVFSWDAEHDRSLVPAYCIANVGARIFAGDKPDTSDAACKLP